MNGDTLIALVGAVGGAGTTRLCLEFAGTLAWTGRDVAVVDADFATQGLATAVPGRVDSDVTQVVAAADPLAPAAVALDLDAPGTAAVAPARAPFERLARAKTSDCARRLAEGLSTIAEAYDAVLVDVPPVAANPAVAAVTAADRVAVVAPDSQRGVDALAPMRDRLRDVDAPADAVVANVAAPTGEAADRTLAGADAAVPESDVTALAESPTSHAAENAFAAGVTGAVEAVTGLDLDRTFEESRALADYLPG